MKKTWIRTGIILLLSLVFFYFFFKNVNLKEVLSHLTDVNVFFLILIIVLVPLHLVTRALRWHYLLKHEKEGISFFNRFAANAVGFTVTLIFPGRLGELAKPLYLAQKENMRKGFVLGTVVVERIFDIFTMCFLLGLFLIAKPFYSSYFNVDKEIYSRLQFWGIIGVAFASVMLLLSLSLYFFKKKTMKVIMFFLRPFPGKFSVKVRELLDEFIEGLKIFHSIGNFLMYVLLSFIVWLGVIFYYWIMFFAYNIKISYFLLFPYVFLTMVGASIPTPGMVGGYHFFSKYGLTAIYRIDDNLAAGMTVVIHAVQVIVTCIIGYAILWKEGISIFQVKKLSLNNEK
ncbi:MAG: flippase-like domain-containing protein [Candidatus Aminicenantes bacterium]|nr:flippase-like domain-containing protein [Candidatus Aminicenantes bacterium]